MSSVDLNIMLRSEAPLFPRFIGICVCKHTYWMNKDNEFYPWMKRVSECESSRQVQDVLKEYNNKEFTDWIHSLQETAKKVAVREAEMIANGALLL